MSHLVMGWLKNDLIQFLTSMNKYKANFLKIKFNSNLKFVFKIKMDKFIVKNYVSQFFQLISTLKLLKIIFLFELKLVQNMLDKIKSEHF